VTSDLSRFKIEARPATVRKQAEAQLRRAIVDGYFQPGEHLSDRALQEMFQVSRTVVREAVRQLEAEDLVVTIPHRGSFVKEVTAAEAEQVYAVREALEDLAARTFTRNATEAQIDRLQRALDAIAAAIAAPGEGRNLVALKQDFYDALLEGSGNKIVEKMLNQILNQNTQLRATTLSNPARLPESVKELGQVVAAARRRDEAAAGAAIVLHVRNAAREAITILNRRATAPSPETGRR
jgi:DNA-binding GntR family transcriptional regulator